MRLKSRNSRKRYSQQPDVRRYPSKQLTHLRRLWLGKSPFKLAGESPTPRCLHTACLSQSAEISLGRALHRLCAQRHLSWLLSTQYQAWDRESHTAGHTVHQPVNCSFLANAELGSIIVWELHVHKGYTLAAQLLLCVFRAQDGNEPSFRTAVFQ